MPVTIDPSDYLAICRSNSMQEPLRVAERVAPSDVCILLMGESGTGKEAVAHLIHNLSGREKLLRFDCAALQPRGLEDACQKAQNS